MDKSVKVLGASAAGSGTAGQGGAGEVTAFPEPHLQLSAPGGIVGATPATAQISAGNTSSITAGQDLNLVSQGDAIQLVKAGIGIFTYGKAQAQDKPNQETGIRMHAGTGKVSTQSQAGATRLTADAGVTVASTAATVSMAAKQHVLMTAQGAMLKLEGGNIMLHAPGAVQMKAGKRDMPGPRSEQIKLPEFPGEKLFAGRFQVLDKDSQAPVAGQLYRQIRDNGSVVFGQTDDEGMTRTAHTSTAEDVKIVMDLGEKFHRVKTSDEEVSDWFNGEDFGEDA